MAASGDGAHPSGVIWSRVEDGFYVGSKDGNFLGYVDQQRDHIYAAFDAHSRFAGTFSDLPSAMHAVNTITHRTEPAR
jgi:hypothetical protein